MAGLKGEVHIIFAKGCMSFLFLFENQYFGVRVILRYTYLSVIAYK